jgi:broad specificity phosphatase PhoE
MDARVASTPPLIFIRHGETDWNAEGRLQGQRDIPLNDKGRTQAQRNGAAVAAAFADVTNFDFIASPLGRARETMEIVRASLGLDPAHYRLDDRLKEISYGEWEGFTGEELSLRDPERIAAREAAKWEFMPPGGESYRLVSDRVVLWLATLDRPTLVVAHGGVGRVLRARVLGVDPFHSLVGIFPQDNAFHWRDGTELVI